MKLTLSFILFFSLFGSSHCYAQTRLRISYDQLGNTRLYEVFTNELLEYKLKGDAFYTSKKIIHMQDSIIVFEDNSEITLAQLKAVRLRMHNHLVNTFQAAFLTAGIGFVSLNTINNIITNESPILDERAALISLALVTTSFLIRELGIKRIFINDKKTLKIVSIDFQHLNSK
jgi:predicted oxidoreductase